VDYLRQSVFGGRSMAGRRGSGAGGGGGRLAGGFVQGRASCKADRRAEAFLQSLLQRRCVSPVVALGQQPR
jgi:energy-converting hydrogenase Eha subunit B